jgi:hypothetical protein
VQSLIGNALRGLRRLDDALEHAMHGLASCVRSVIGGAKWTASSVLANSTQAAVFWLWVDLCHRQEVVTGSSPNCLRTE